MTMRPVQRDRNQMGTGSGPAPDEPAEDPLAFDTVILPARVDAEVARRVAVASNREGVSVADLLGRAAAAYDWQVED
jgi:hypothetical protein